MPITRTNEPINKKDIQIDPTYAKNIWTKYGGAPRRAPPDFRRARSSEAPRFRGVPTSVEHARTHYSVLFASEARLVCSRDNLDGSVAFRWRSVQGPVPNHDGSQRSHTGKRHTHPYTQPLVPQNRHENRAHDRACAHTRSGLVH